MWTMIVVLLFAWLDALPDCLPDAATPLTPRPTIMLKIPVAVDPGDEIDWVPQCDGRGCRLVPRPPVQAVPAAEADSSPSGCSDDARPARRGWCRLRR